MQRPSTIVVLSCSLLFSAYVNLDFYLNFRICKVAVYYKGNCFSSIQ